MSTEIIIIKTLMHTLIDIGLVADCAEKLVSRDSEYTGAAIGFCPVGVSLFAINYGGGDTFAT